MHFLSLISVYISSFIEISLVLYELWSWHGNIKSNKGDNFKLFTIKLWFLYYALSLINMYVYFRFHWNIFSTFRFVLNANKVWLTKCDGWTDGRTWRTVKVTTICFHSGDNKNDLIYWYVLTINIFCLHKNKPFT